MTESPPTNGAFEYTFATWIYLLHAAGIEPNDTELASDCQAIDESEDEEAGDAAGNALIDRVKALMHGNGSNPETVYSVARQLYGDRVKNDIGQGERDERTSRVRKYQFDKSLPWLARIWERRGGAVTPSWLLVERVTDEVTAMDPNPWDDIDEERHISVHDFQVLWELDECTAVYLD